MKLMVVIPARGGSVGIPGKNIKHLCGRPLISYSIDVAREFVGDVDIYVSTDDQKIIDVVESECGLKVPFVRPAELATSTATTSDVLVHAVSYTRKMGKFYDTILLLQPTSPLRTKEDIEGALKSYSPDVDMIIGVKKSDVGAVLCHDDDNGYIVSPFNRTGARRQDVQELYEVNGAVYVINVTSLMEKGMSKFDKRIKYVMPALNSVDIDTPDDWDYAEFLMKRRLSHVS